MDLQCILHFSSIFYCPHYKPSAYTKGASQAKTREGSPHSPAKANSTDAKSDHITQEDCNRVRKTSKPSLPNLYAKQQPPHWLLQQCNKANTHINTIQYFAFSAFEALNTKKNKQNLRIILGKFYSSFYNISPTLHIFACSLGPSDECKAERRRGAHFHTSVRTAQFSPS